jgi:hypothetical protein
MHRPSWLRNWHIVLAVLLVIAGLVLWAVFGELQWGGRSGMARRRRHGGHPVVRHLDMEP